MPHHIGLTVDTELGPDGWDDVPETSAAALVAGSAVTPVEEKGEGAAEGQRSQPPTSLFPPSAAERSHQ